MQQHDDDDSLILLQEPGPWHESRGEEEEEEACSPEPEATNAEAEEPPACAEHHKQMAVEDFELVHMKEVEQGTFLDALLERRLAVCIKPHSGLWHRGRIVSYDTPSSKYLFQVEGEQAPRELPFFESVFEIIDHSPAVSDQDWVDLGNNYMIESIMFSERGDVNFHLFT